VPALRLTAEGRPLDTDRMRHTPMTILLLLGLACTRVDSGTDEALAAASSSEATSSESTASATSSESVGTSDSSSSEAEGESVGSSESSTTTSTDTTSETSTSDSTDTTSETGFGGVTVDLGVLALVDVNPNSATYQQKRHPSDHEGQLSAWYFAHAT
jgi:hypothetical protein